MGNPLMKSFATARLPPTLRLLVRGAPKRACSIDGSLESISECRHMSTGSTTGIHNHKSRPDPFARRPTAHCDPYGQGGQPLSLGEAHRLLATLDPSWTIAMEGKGDTGVGDSPQALVREFAHIDFIAGSKFVAKIAAVSQLFQHFPSVHLERRILSRQKSWQVVTRIRCHTLVLGGLSTHDFHLAMLIDVEVQRPETKQLMIPQENSASELDASLT